MDPDLKNQQIELCRHYGASWVESPLNHKVGVSENVKTGVVPINGLRQPPSRDTTGWYIWAGEKLSKDPEFFRPLHVEHLAEWCPVVLRYLGLPPGWRFLVASNYEDVWYDPSLTK